VTGQVERLLGDAFRTRWYAGLRAALSVGIPLLIGVSAGRPSWGALASIGSFAGFYGANTPYRHRIRLVAWVGVALAVVVPLGGLCASRAWLSVALAGVVAGIASFVCLALRVPPPREYLIVLAVLAASGIPASPAVAVRECALVAGGALTGILVTMAPALGPRRTIPQARALTRAWAAVGDVLSAAGTPEADSARRQAVASVADAREALRQARITGDDPQRRSLAAAEVVLTSALSVSIEASAPVDPSWAQAARRLAAAAGRAPEQGAGTAVGQPADLPGLRWALKAARSILQRGLDSAEDGTELDRRGAAERLREALSPTGIVVPAAARIAVAVAVAAGVGRILGLDHSYWVGLTAAASLQAGNITLLLHRSLNRLAGTVVGVALAWAVFTLHPVVIVVALVAVLAQFLGEVLIRAAYGLGIVFVSILALSIYDLAVPSAQIGSAVGARVQDTAIGAAVVIVLRLVLWPRATGAAMPQVQAQTLTAVAALYRSRWLGAGRVADLQAPQRRLQERLLHLQAISEDARADQIIGAPPAREEQVTLAIDELAILALGVPFGRPRPPQPDAEALVGRLDQFAAALQNGSPPAAAEHGIELPGYPRTQAAAHLLASAIG
jgi:uncharacterized membrane protein YccC